MIIFTSTKTRAASRRWAALLLMLVGLLLMRLLLVDLLLMGLLLAGLRK